MDENYNFELITKFGHYISSIDKTSVDINNYVKNSKNVYKKRSGTIANRPGLKVRGALNAAQAGVISSFEWDGPFASTRVIRVTSDGKLSVEYDNNDGRGPLWYDLLTGLVGLKFVFSGEYFDVEQDKQRLLAANGSVLSIYAWEGGITSVASTTGLIPGVISQGVGAGFSLHSGGTGYAVGDILTINGGNSDAQVIVATVSGGVIQTLATYVVPQGTGYAVGTYSTNNATPSSVGTGATVNVLSVYQGGQLTKSNLSTTFFEDGFSKESNTSTWQFVYNGVTYTYGGGQDSGTLTGIVPDPSVIPAGAVIISPFIQYFRIPISAAAFQFSLFANFTCDFLTVIQNQVYIGSYGSPAIFVSSQTDFTDYTPVANGGVGTPFTLFLDNNAVGISQKNYVPTIFGGSSDIYQVNISSIVVPQPTVSGTGAGSLIEQVAGLTKITLAENEAPISQEFIDSNGEYIVWLGQDHQVHVLGAFNNVFLSDKAPVLSQPVYDELIDVNFTNGAVRFIGEYIYLTAPVQGTHYIYQTREFVDEAGTAKSEKIWNSPFVAGISRFANINGVVYGHSYLNPMIYQVWDTGQWHDDSPTGDPLPYECVLAMAYQHIPIKGDRGIVIGGKFDKVYVEGYMSNGTPLLGTVYFDYQGATDAQTIYINNPAIPGAPPGAVKVKNVKFFSYDTAPSLGADYLGDNPLGEGITRSTDAQDYLPKFRAIRKVKPKNCFEAQLELYSYAIDARWEILRLGFNWVESQDVPKEIL